MLPLLRARVTAMVSIAARSGRLDWDDLQSEHAYAPVRAYNRSKLASMLFGLELDRRSKARGWGITSNVAIRDSRPPTCNTPGATWVGRALRG